MSKGKWSKQNWQKLRKNYVDASSQSSDNADTSAPAPPATKSKKTAFDQLLGEEEETADNAIEDELAQYFTDKVAARDCHHYAGGNKTGSVSSNWPK